MRVFLLLLCGWLAAPALLAQGTVSLTLEKGRLRLDGRRQPDAYVPPTLNLDAVEGRFNFVGPSNATFDLGGVRYRVEGERFVLDRAPTAPADVVLDNRQLSALPAGGYVFVSVDWLSDPEAARIVRYAAQQEYALDATAAQIAAEINALGPRDPRRHALEERLRRCLYESFDVMQANTLRDIELVEAELRAARRAHERRERHRDQIVGLRLRQLLAR